MMCLINFLLTFFRVVHVVLPYKTSRTRELSFLELSLALCEVCSQQPFVLGFLVSDPMPLRINPRTRSSYPLITSLAVFVLSLIHI